MFLTYNHKYGIMVVGLQKWEMRTNDVWHLLLVIHLCISVDPPTRCSEGKTNKKKNGGINLRRFSQLLFLEHTIHKSKKKKFS